MPRCSRGSNPRRSRRSKPRSSRGSKPWPREGPQNANKISAFMRRRARADIGPTSCSGWDCAGEIRMSLSSRPKQNALPAEIALRQIASGPLMPVSVYECRATDLNWPPEYVLEVDGPLDDCAVDHPLDHRPLDDHSLVD